MVAVGHILGDMFVRNLTTIIIESILRNSCFNKTKNLEGTPKKINIKPKNGGLVQMVFLFNWAIFR